MGSTWQTASAASEPSDSKSSAERTVVVACADLDVRQRLSRTLADMRWSVREASNGAETIAYLDEQQPKALLLDQWMPDLKVNDLEGQLPRFYPGMDVLWLHGRPFQDAAEHPQRNELLHALRWVCNSHASASSLPPQGPDPCSLSSSELPSKWRGTEPKAETTDSAAKASSGEPHLFSPALPELVGATKAMLELARLVRLVAPRSTTVLIEGETGTGKEVVAQALHRLSTRSTKPFAVLNCAAIPESLLEAELFGHARGAFTGAVGARVGRIEAAHGGTLFLDEIGEMPVALQAKMLRFLESGELQRVGHNEITKVDVRVIAATHQHLERRSEEGTFRLDLYHRLAVFPLEIPPLRERKEDIRALSEHLLRRLAKGYTPTQITGEALQILANHSWPGNVRELAHVLERASILAGDEAGIDTPHIRFRLRER